LEALNLMRRHRLSFVHAVQRVGLDEATVLSYVSPGLTTDAGGRVRAKGADRLLRLIPF
jgi:hypothetical protein